MTPQTARDIDYYTPPTASDLDQGRVNLSEAIEKVYEAIGNLTLYCNNYPRPCEHITRMRGQIGYLCEAVNYLVRIGMDIEDEA